jgi:hypothetical protein
MQPSTEVAMSEVALEADIRGHDKSDANDPSLLIGGQFCCDAQYGFFSTMW